VSNFQLPETQFERTATDKLAGKTHLEWKNNSFKHILYRVIETGFQGLQIDILNHPVTTLITELQGVTVARAKLSQTGL